MPDITRRQVLQALGAAGACALAGCGKYPGAAPVATVPEGWMRGEERFVTSTCGQCQAGCGIRVRVYEGRAIRIDGNREHPVNRGGLGPKGQSGLQVLYHPDRIRGPLRREGERGSGKWRQIGWDEAIKDVAGRLADLRAHGTPEGLVVVDGEPRGMMRQLWERFLSAYGSPNHLDGPPIMEAGKVLAMNWMHGLPELPAYDWKGTQYVLGFGASLFESWCQTIHLMRASAYMRRGTSGHRVKFVQVSPRFAVTAAKADEWVPIDPATYGALALGIAHVLVKEKLHDEAFVHEHTFGFEDWKDEKGVAHRGFRDLLEKDYPPEKVTRLTGVPVETIERLAHEMAEHRPALAFADGGAAAATNGLGTAMSIHALNALLGNLQRPGGMLVQRQAPLAPWTPVAGDEAARKGLATPRVDGVGAAACPLGRGFVQHVPEAILRGGARVGAVVLYKANPVFSKPDGAAWIEALRRVPLVVSCSPLPDESTMWADYVLPDHTYLERWELVEPVPSIGVGLVGLRQPVVRPLHATLATGDVVIRLAKGIGGTVGAAFPWADYRASLEERLKGFATVADGGKSAATAMTEFERDSVWAEEKYPFEKWEGTFPTPSGKFEFFSQGIAARLAGLFPDPAALERHLSASGVVTRGDDLCLPHWEPPRFAGDPKEFPFVLVAYRGTNYAEGGVRHLPGLRELPTAGRHAWKERLELHPSDAAALGVVEGDTVRVESPSGLRHLCAVLQPGIRPGTVGLPLGHGPWPAIAEATGGYALLANLSDPLAGIFALQGTRVRVKKETV